MESPWQYSTVHNSACKVIEEQTLWGQMVCRVRFPNQDAVVRVHRSALPPLSADLQPEIEAGRIAYVASRSQGSGCARGSTSATEGHVLLAPMESNVIPLPHQIHALSRAISGDRVRYLLVDEVVPAIPSRPGWSCAHSSCFVREQVREIFLCVMAAEVESLCGPCHHPMPKGELFRSGSATGYVLHEGRRKDIKRPRVRSREAALANYAEAQAAGRVV